MSTVCGIKEKKREKNRTNISLLRNKIAYVYDFRTLPNPEYDWNLFFFISDTIRIYLDLPPKKTNERKRENCTEEDK